VRGENLSGGQTKSCGCMRVGCHSNDEEIINHKFHDLMVIDKVEGNFGGRSFYMCECDCGGKTVVSGSDLVSGHVKSCGCRKLAKDDLTGQRFGSLTVLFKTDSMDKQGSAYYQCHCDCGENKVIRGQSLKTGLTKSCGCGCQRDTEHELFIIQEDTLCQMFGANCEKDEEQCCEEVDSESANCCDGNDSCDCNKK